MAEAKNTPAVPKEKKAKSKGKLRRIGIELEDTLSAEIAEYVKAHPMINGKAVIAAVREKARVAATAATNGKVAEIVAESFTK